MLGELLAGRALFDNVTSGSDLLPRLRRGETPDIQKYAPKAPEGLRGIVARLIAPDRSDRYPTARDAALALTRHLRSLDEAWDAAGLEHYVSRFFSRTSSLVPP